MQVTEKWLGEIGGWQAMKAAREFVRLGQVSEIRQEGGVFHGLVGSGNRKFRAVLAPGEGRNAEARCACPEARRGLVCAHSLAVALAAVSPPASGRDNSIIQKSQEEPRSGQGRATTPAPSPRLAPPSAELENIPEGEFTVFIAIDQLEKLAATGGPPHSRQARPMGRSTIHSSGNATTVPVFLQFAPSPGKTDVEVARWLLHRGMPVRTTPMRLAANDLEDLLVTLSGHPRVRAGVPNANNSQHNHQQKHHKALNINRLRLLIRSSDNKHNLNIQIEPLMPSIKPLSGFARSWLWLPDEACLASLPEALPEGVRSFILSLVRGGQQERSLHWIAANLEALHQVLEPDSPEDLVNQLHVVPVQPKFRLWLEGNLRRVEATLAVLSPDADAIATEATYPIQDATNPLLFYIRNLPAEQAARRRLENAGFQADARGNLELKGEREILRFLSSDLPRLRTQFVVEEGVGWRNATRGLAIIRPKVRPPVSLEMAGTGVDWLSLEVAYEASDGFSISRNEVLRLIRSGNRDVRADNGRRYLLDADGCEELEETVQDMESRFESGSQLAVRARQAEVLEGFVERPEILAAHLHPLLEEPALKSMLGGLADTLRPYQLEGVRWMERHSRTQGGGVLADEMGLGKTVQTLALLRILLSRRKSQTPQPGPALVICPTSLLTNWSDEAARFTPELRTHVSHDSERRASLEGLSCFDVIFTSYALIVRDLAFYTPLQFTAVILDEASYIRNPDTETAKAVRQLRATCRFALTGTPVENSVRDLWSIFEFLAPRCLPTRGDFQERFVKPLSQPDSSQAKPVMERLRRLIRPNLLRRTKHGVAKDLPEKIEKVLWCDLSPAQREVYQRLLDEGREEIRQARRRSGQGGARMTMFTVLLRLRQVCNDLLLVGIQDTSSGKWPVLEELLQETLDGGHKALIFSQFVSMLRLVRAKVETLNIPFSYLDGSSQDRAEQVAAFQNDPAKRLFLVSLKAGGYGLNLTAADEVVLVDPWWNPAVEAQAIDRAHRIGQGKPVTAYRLVTRGTVEEKILKLQSQKRAVMDMALDDDATVFTGVTDDELEAMLS